MGDLEVFHELDRLGLTMFGQMTAGSWIYIGTQVILQGTYETFAACGRTYFAPTTRPLPGKVVVACGLGGMGRAQPLAAKLAGAVILCAEVSLDKALAAVSRYRARRLLDGGARVALATGYNPGLAPKLGLRLTIQLAASKVSFR